MLFTDAFNNLNHVLNKTSYNIIRYNFQKDKFKNSIFYTHLNGLANQIMILIQGDKNTISFPVYVIKNKDQNNTINFYIDTFVDNEYFNLLYPLFTLYKNNCGKASTNLFFKDIKNKLEKITINNIVPQNMTDYQNTLKKTTKTSKKYNLPFFQKIVHKNMSNEMQEKIQRIYPDGYKIVKFLKKIDHTLSFTDNPSLAKDLHIVLHSNGYK